MNKHSTRLLVGGLLLALPLSTSLADSRGQVDYARVIESRPIYETVRVAVPERRCWDEEVTRPVTGRRSYTSVILGSIIGGAIGSEVGHGRHKEWVTAAGAVLGGSIGNDLYQRNRRDTVTTVERQCTTVQDYRTEERAIGYRVKYRYRGQTYVTRMDHDPGARVRVAVSVRLAE